MSIGCPTSAERAKGVPVLQPEHKGSQYLSDSRDLTLTDARRDQSCPGLPTITAVVIETAVDVS